MSSVHSNLGKTAVSYCGPKVWNTIPMEIRSTSECRFKSLYKGHLLQSYLQVSGHQNRNHILFYIVYYYIVFFCLVILPKYTFYISIITVGYNLRWQIAFYCIPAITNVTLFKLLLFIDKFKFVKTSKSNCLYFLFLSGFIVLTFTNFDFELQTTNWKIHGNLENQSNLTCQILRE